MDDNAKNRKWYHFNYTHTPCARSSLIYGISSGLIVGGLIFSRTKIIMKSCDYAVASFAIVSLSSWAYCSYSINKEANKVRMTVEALQKQREIRAKNAKLDENSDKPEITHT